MNLEDLLAAQDKAKNHAKAIFGFRKKSVRLTIAATQTTAFDVTRISQSDRGELPKNVFLFEAIRDADTGEPAVSLLSIPTSGKTSVEIPRIQFDTVETVTYVPAPDTTGTGREINL